MANAQCARLTKFIIPSVTETPTESRNRSIPYANPSNRTPTRGPIIFGPAPSLAPPTRSGFLVDLHPRLCGRVGELAGTGHDQPDLDGLLCARGRSYQRSCDEARNRDRCSAHGHPRRLL